ncbi:Hypothetical protein GcLGCM259_1127 [Glutamicibacter creatinolyticus]|uniref:Uncharacterized protein n=1 Tax=Glutamicibacter creatinolyticus TaxID=162496 RepID=A0A5B7WS12_9MICC|nr:AAA family ATPase [Glutamicibacter creatinolyticus]QCY46871.1 Hypothetical protein GcLGCM259_1127 [Glutamicibacter creatinolyticus]
MKICKISVRGFRSLEKLDVDIEDYAVLVGPNGCGKSTVLHALDWFVNGRELHEDDLFKAPGSDSSSSDQIEVEVTFTDLNTLDRELLKEYGRGSTATFRKTWTKDNKVKVVGRALQGPNFAKIRQMTKVGEFRPEYVNLRQEHSDLPDLGSSPSKDAVWSALASWEDAPQNRGKLEAVQSSDANHMFGINGQNIIRELIQVIFIPAGTDLAAEVGSTGKGSSLSLLIGALTSNAGSKAKEEWSTKHADVLQDLNTAVHEEIRATTAAATTRVNSTLERLVPSARLEFQPNEISINPKIDPSVTTRVEIAGNINDVTRQGHGVQRAVMMSVMQAMATAQNDEVLESEATGPSTALVICVEEPEIFQHPARARAFAQVLSELSEAPGTQVLIGTHSPYFIRPDQFENLKRMNLINGRSTVKQSNIGEIAKKTGKDARSVLKQVQQWFPTQFSEGFFADAAVLVEGDTDQVILEAIGSRIGKDLHFHGISILNMQGKNNLHLGYEILQSVHVPTYIIFDGDADTCLLKNHDNPEKQKQAHSSNKDATNKIVDWVSVNSTTPIPYKFGDETTSFGIFTAFHTDIERELDKWPSFTHALSAEGGVLRTKHASVYRAAALNASREDIPETLIECIATIVDFTTQHSN